VSSIDCVKQQKRAMIGRYTKSDNLKGLTQVLTTLVALALLWWAAIVCAGISCWLVAAAIPLITLFNVRVFGLMHECGHGSLFRDRRLNRAVGFLLGVVSGMPQYVWSQHHNYHHAHNGNWEKYRGLYTTLSVDEYAAMTDAQQRMYRRKCSIAFAPFAGLIYVILNPRFTWLKGSIGLVSHIVKGKIAQPNLSMKAHAASFETRYWQSRKEYWHMFGNNVVLLSVWVFMCWACGTVLFFTIYLISASLAGGAGVVLFTVQHTFEHSYASDREHWDYDTGAIAGSSFLNLALLVKLVYRQYCLSSHSPSIRKNFKLSFDQVPQRISVSLFGCHPPEVISHSQSFEIHSLGHARTANHFGSITNPRAPALRARSPRRVRPTRPRVLNADVVVQGAYS
jgi:acyl-lipid omega-6 desaturase (Delta-12 desaturase)